MAFPPLLSEMYNRDGFLSSEIGGPSSRHKPNKPLPQSGPRTETCRNCENRLLSQVLSFLSFSFGLFSGHSQPLNGLRREDGWQKDEQSCVYFDLEQYCQVDFVEST